MPPRGRLKTTALGASPPTPRPAGGPRGAPEVATDALLSPLCTALLKDSGTPERAAGNEIEETSRTTKIVGLTRHRGSDPTWPALCRAAGFIQVQGPALEMATGSLLLRPQTSSRGRGSLPSPRSPPPSNQREALSHSGHGRAGAQKVLTRPTNE